MKACPAYLMRKYWKTVIIIPFTITIGTGSLAKRGRQITMKAT